ncbi:S-layer homology domain-containing protein [Lysinibacillus xylanilyticus]|uniref:YcdB/YcdC domain-containing protein n=1 Tax=Lysinibacillus xylanilyticus TaxID=582475 RepID=UPI002B2514A5|nr:YcdB/YcdC domain-containing protein [Lysinibacillus xylanilyticus]MEB2302145.1 S-layer homology domain-containing protein [Lysinibacillus xylanilyticus]
MVNFKKLGIILTSTAFSVGVLSPMAQASANVKEPQERVAIQVASTETKVTKNMLIKQLNTLFPGKFNFVTEKDFSMGQGHYYNDDKTIRYDLDFHKRINGKDVFGNFTFKGEDLELENFYYQPANIADALYPVKYSEVEAKKIAQDFLKKLPNTANYKLREDSIFDNFDLSFSRPLTEPIRYSFTYSPTHNGVLISDESIHIVVLANGEVTSMYRNTESTSKATFDNLEQKKNESDILTQVRENLSVDLRYMADYNYETGEASAKLVYMPSTGFNGVHAINGQWRTMNGFTSEVPKAKGVEKLASQPLSPRKKDITVAEVEELAKSLLKVDSDKVKLQIESVDERENENGETIYEVNYMYYSGNEGTGTTFEVNKATGEITNYWDMRRDFMETDVKVEPISKDAALAKAIDYLKEWAPSYIHNYSKPLEDATYDKYSKQYYFSFPRIVNGIAVVGDEISVGISADGKLNALHVNNRKIDNWPAVNKAIPADKAKATFSEGLKLELQYAKLDSEDNHHYDLVYSPVYNGSLFNGIDATTGKWLQNVDDAKDKPAISHPTAGGELTFLLRQNVLEVKDPANFNADTAVTKGEALKILVKSLSYGYDFGPNGRDNEKQSFNNIDKKHPLYKVVEQAVRMDILQPANQFAVDTTLTRQELAEWLVRILNLESVAKHSDIYKLNFTDASSIDTAYAGYVALASAMGLIDGQQNKFNATAKVTYADLAISTVRLAKAVYEENDDRRYYY